MKNYQLFLMFMSLPWIGFGSEYSSLQKNRDLSIPVQHNSSVFEPIQEISKANLKNRTFNIEQVYITDASLEEVVNMLIQRSGGWSGISWAAAGLNKDTNRVHFALNPKTNFGTAFDNIEAVVYNAKCTTGCLKIFPSINLWCCTDIGPKQFLLAPVKKVFIGTGVKRIGTYAFSESLIEEISGFPPNVSDDYIGSWLDVAEGAFGACRYLNKVSLPFGQVTMGQNALWTRCRINEITIPLFFTKWESLNDVKNICIRIDDCTVSKFMNFCQNPIYQKDKLDIFIKQKSAQKRGYIQFVFQDWRCQLSEVYKKNQFETPDSSEEYPQFEPLLPDLPEDYPQEKIAKDIISLFVDFKEHRVKRLSEIFSTPEKFLFLLACIDPDFWEHVEKCDRHTAVQMLLIHRILFNRSGDLIPKARSLLNKFHMKSLIQKVLRFVQDYERDLSPMLTAVFYDDIDAFQSILHQSKAEIDEKIIKHILRLGSENIFEYIAALNDGEKFTSQNFNAALLGENDKIINWFAENKKVPDDAEKSFVKFVLRSQKNLAAYIVEKFSNLSHRVYAEQKRSFKQNMFVYNNMVIGIENARSIFDRVFQPEILHAGKADNEQKDGNAQLDKFMIKCPGQDSQERTRRENTDFQKASHKKKSLSVGFFSLNLTEKDVNDIKNRVQQIIEIQKYQGEVEVVIDVLPGVSILAPVKAKLEGQMVKFVIEQVQDFDRFFEKFQTEDMEDCRIA